MIKSFEFADDAGFTIAVNILMQSISLYFDKNMVLYIYILLLIYQGTAGRIPSL
jgi:hypothetical protein